jgi:hypothetical protein
VLVAQEVLRQLQHPGIVVRLGANQLLGRFYGRMVVVLEEMKHLF